MGELVLNLYYHEAQALVGGYPGSDNRTSSKASPQWSILNPEALCSGGTGLYRHRPTGLDRLPIAMTSDVIQLARQHGMNTAALKREDG